MAAPIITRRLVYHISGYDFTMSVQAVHRRFLRELRRFEGTWSVSSSVSPPVIGTDEAAWDVETNGPNWHVHTRYRFLRWDDVIAADGRKPLWQRVLAGLIAFFDYIGGGTLWGYLRTNWRYALFFLYPYLLFAALVAIAWFAGSAAGRLVGSALPGGLVGLAAFLALMHWPARWLLLPQLFDDWAFARTYIRGGEPVLEQRLDRVARELGAAAHSGDVDEIIIIGHSLGAVLAIDLIDRALSFDRSLGTAGARIALLSVGSSILKIGLHRGARRFHAAVTRVASAPGILWVEYQALTDVMNFYKTDPVAEMRLTATTHPLIRTVRIKNMLDPVIYKRIRRNFFRVHCQFVSANDRRAPYDFFMLMCGPLTAEQQARSPDGAASAIGIDGALIAPDQSMAQQPAAQAASAPATQD
ncbi:MAG: hypothetical protein R3D62_00875 [Xanthobacteraceae bacterium]